MAPLASTDDIKQALEKAITALETPAANVSPPQAARLQTIARRLKRGCTHLLNTGLRLRYDFKQGHVRADARMEDASGDPRALAELRSAWAHCYPKQVDEAATLARQALDAEGDSKFEEAVSIGKKALELDPFNRELRVAVSLWSARTRKPKKGLHRGPRKIKIEGMVF